MVAAMTLRLRYRTWKIRLMCWVAFDRVSRLAEKRSLAGPTERWQQILDAIYEDIFTNFWSEDRKAFVQYKGANTLDASVLLMPLMRFISPVDPRWPCRRPR